MSKAKRNPINKIRKIVALLLAIFLVVFIFCYSIHLVVSAVNLGIETTVAYKVTRSVSINTRCFVIRDEDFVKSSTEGVKVSFVDNGQRIAKNDTVSIVFDSQTDASAYLKMNELKKDIAHYEALRGKADVNTFDVDTITKKINIEMYDYLDCLDSGDYSGAIEAAELYRDTVTHKQISVGEEIDVSDKLNSLKEQYNELKANEYSYKEIKADSSGYYINNADGYEKTINYADIDSLTADDIKAALDSKPDAVPEDVVGRAVSSFKWYIGCVVDKQDTIDLSYSKTYYINFPRSGIKRLPVKLHKIGDRSSDEVMLIFSCDTMNEGLAELRIENAEIITNEYTGFEIPTEAIRTDENNQPGVYVIRGHIIGYRKIKVVKAFGDVTLVDRPDDKKITSGFIRLHDRVINEGVDLYDDKLV